MLFFDEWKVNFFLSFKNFIKVGETREEYLYYDVVRLLIGCGRVKIDFSYYFNIENENYIFKDFEVCFFRRVLEYNVFFLFMGKGYICILK